MKGRYPPMGTITKETKLAILKDRYNKLENRKVNEKCGGCLRKLKRQIRHLENAGTEV